ncbi:hypothetical protein ES689_13535 [Frigoribacterium sp. ACAM 257]|uniref:hypothetical protein n=1 Tax=Frigoribacterium sp. ACAM 257 TaxID=2508998 RepID=UPI0011B9588A|nr:hypothetical protein [Frigoribacterium sp. ACAM 257]TWX35596.1 hypothetical protein ES689_13535 [Frigoribacterium sp. ACAM 257]
MTAAPLTAHGRPEEARAASRTAPVVTLHFARRTNLLLVPLFVLGVTLVVSIVIQLAIQRAGGDPGSAEYVAGARSNPGVAWALSGYLVATGVATVASTFPLAAALGTTRRDFALGTAATQALVALFVTAVFVGMLGLERLTGHWFGGFYVFDVDVLGAGDPLVLALAALLGSWLALAIGGVYGASWLRFGPRGPLVISVAVVVVLAVVVLAAVPSFAAVAEAFRPWWLAVAAVALISLSVSGTFGFLRRASVR